MPRAIITPELTETLRSIRLQNKVQAKKLAEHLQKSPAYISKLENGGIQTIDTKELYNIFQFISRESNSMEVAEKIYKSLKIRYSSKEIEEQLWFTNYDTVDCLLPIPEALIQELNDRIKKLEISRQYLNERINANEALTSEEINDNSIPFNQWFHQKRIGGSAQSIKIKLSEKQMNKILDQQIDVAPYVFVFCISFYILKIESYGETVSLSDEENSALMKRTTSILNSYKFYSIFEKNALIAQKQTEDEVHELLNSFDNTNIEIINDILTGLHVASKHNIKSTNTQLGQFSKNMHWDLGFMLRLISMEFTLLQKTSVSNKRNLLNEIEGLIQKYSAIPAEQNIIEEY